MPTILLTGSSGKTSSRIARLLHENGHDYLIAGRSGVAPAPHADRAVKFDFANPASLAAAYDRSPDISALYIVPPSGAADPVAEIKALIDYARSRGTRRFVVLGVSTFPAGGPFTGQTHQYLIELAKSEDIEWAVVRPTWFMENFSETSFPETIRKNDAVYSAAEDGRVPFVSADDIAAVAYRALTDEKPHNTDHMVLGPESLTYDEAAAIVSAAIGRKVTHVRNTKEQQKAFYENLGVSAAESADLAGLEVHMANGGEDHASDDIFKVTGRKPVRFADYVQKVKAVWARE